MVPNYQLPTSGRSRHKRVGQPGARNWTMVLMHWSLFLVSIREVRICLLRSRVQTPMAGQLLALPVGWMVNITIHSLPAWPEAPGHLTLTTGIDASTTP